MTTQEFNSTLANETDYLRPYAQSLTHDPEQANDLYQETMYRALKNQDKYRPGTNLKAWLYTIMRNIFINNYRKSKNSGQVTADIPEDVLAYNSKVQTNNGGWSKVRMNEIKAANNNLPGHYRTCFELYYTGYKYNEIAEFLNEPLGTVKSRIHFARKTLTKTLQR